MAVSPDGLQNQCKQCNAAATLARYHKNPEPKRVAVREYRANNPEKIVEARRLKALSLSEEEKKEKRDYNRAYGEKNREALNEYARAWRRLNPSYESDRCKTDLNFKLMKRLRSRLASALMNAGGAKKAARTFDLLGCPIVWLEAYLEEQFVPGMTWENHGPVWHIDHIRPIASFDLTDPEQQRICFHWSNLQPLFALDNLRKSDTYDP